MEHFLHSLRTYISNFKKTSFLAEDEYVPPYAYSYAFAHKKMSAKDLKLETIRRTEPFVSTPQHGEPVPVRNTEESVGREQQPELPLVQPTSKVRPTSASAARGGSWWALIGFFGAAVLFNLIKGALGRKREKDNKFEGNANKPPTP